MSAMPKFSFVFDSDTSITARVDPAEIGVSIQCEI